MEPIEIGNGISRKEIHSMEMELILTSHLYDESHWNDHLLGLGQKNARLLC